MFKQVKENKTGSFGYNRFWSSFRRHKLALSGLMFLGVLTLSSVFSSLIANYDPSQQGDLVASRYLSPSLEHPFGTDKFGRDVFSRVLYGGRISLAISVSVVFLSVTIGLIYGTISGYFGGFIDGIMMRLLDFLLAFPIIFLIITFVALFQITHWHLVLVMGLTGWMETARIIRAEVLSLKEQDYILAVKGFGFKHSRIILRHIIPNCLTPVIAAIPLKIGEIILFESALSFLGIGVQPPTPSWGNIISDGRDVLLHAWWISTFPGIFITLTVMSINLIGDAVQDSLDPRY